MQNNDFTFDSAFKKKYSSLSEPSLTYGSQSDYATMQTEAPSFSAPKESTGFGSSLGTPEMMAIGTGLQILGQYLDAPYKEMAARQSMETQRRDKQDAALRNLQNISQLYGRL